VGEDAIWMDAVMQSPEEMIDGEGKKKKVIDHGS